MALGNQATTSTLRYHARTRLTDPLASATTRRRKVFDELLSGMKLVPGQRVLDLGSRSLTLARLVRMKAPECSVYAVSDRGDEIALGRRSSPEEEAINWEEAIATELPFKRNFFDRVCSMLYMHRLPEEDRTVALREIRRVLKRNGEFHWLDWGKPANLAMRALFFGVRLREGLPETREIVSGDLQERLKASGFKKVEERASWPTLGGTLRYFVAS